MTIDLSQLIGGVLALAVAVTFTTAKAKKEIGWYWYVIWMTLLPAICYSLPVHIGNRVAISDKAEQLMLDSLVGTGWDKIDEVLQQPKIREPIKMKLIQNFLGLEGHESMSLSIDQAGFMVDRYVSYPSGSTTAKYARNRLATFLSDYIDISKE